MAWALVQNPAAANGSGTSVAKAFGSNVTAGNVLVAFATCDPDTTCTFTSSGASWTTTNSFFNSTASQKHFIGVAFNVPGGATTVTATFGSAGSFLGIIVAEFSGGSAASAVDVTSPGRHNASSTTPTDAAIVTTANGDLILCSMLQDNGGVTITAGGGATLLTQDTTDLMNGEFFEQATAGSIAMTFNSTGSIGNSTTTLSITTGGAAVLPVATKSTNRHPGKSPGKARFFQSPRPTAAGNIVNIDGSLTVTATTTATIAITHTIGGSLTVTANRSATIAITHTVGGSLTVTVNRTATVAVTHTIGGSLTVTVNRTATVAVTHTIGGTRPITVGLSATVAVTHTIGGTRPITANRTATVAVTHTVSGTRPITVGLTASIITGKDISGSRPTTVNRTASIAVTHTIGGTLGIVCTRTADASTGGGFAQFLPFF